MTHVLFIGIELHANVVSFGTTRNNSWKHTWQGSEVMLSFQLLMNWLPSLTFWFGFSFECYFICDQNVLCCCHQASLRSAAHHSSKSLACFQRVASHTYIYVAHSAALLDAAQSGHYVYSFCSICIWQSVMLTVLSRFLFIGMSSSLLFLEKKRSAWYASLWIVMNYSRKKNITEMVLYTVYSTSFPPLTCMTGLPCFHI